MKPDFSFFAFTQKSNNYICFFLLKVVPPWTFILWMNKNLIFSNPLVSGTKKEAPKVLDAFGAPFKGIFPLFTKREYFFFKTFFIKVSHFITEHLEHI